MGTGAPVDVPHHYQQTDHTCGPATMKMVMEGVLGVEEDEQKLATAMGTSFAPGTRQRVMLEFARRNGMAAFERHTDTAVEEIRTLMKTGHVVVVCYFLPDEGYDHYAVVHSITSKKILLNDPWFGPETELDLESFDANWRSDPKVETRRHRWLMAIKVPHPEL
jgi:ABC-type bacteriocin/lantibiotic exporter with double-glycine peptidase domain